MKLDSPEEVQLIHIAELRNSIYNNLVRRADTRLGHAIQQLLAVAPPGSLDLRVTVDPDYPAVPIGELLLLIRSKLAHITAREGIDGEITRLCAAANALDTSNRNTVK